MTDFFPFEQLNAIADVIRAQIKIQPRVGLILAETVEDCTIIPYASLPAWPVATVAGHEGRLVIGQLENQAVIVMQGRLHYYEGYSMAQVTLPVRVMQRLGVQVLIVTNAAGAVNPGYEPGDLMLIVDHLNLIGMAGLSPLRGPNLDQLGPRFPDMSRAYDRDLCQAARQAASASQVKLHEGVYACLAGPSFETPADLRFLRLAGVDAVGMSTVSEVTIARHAGTRVLGVSGISNKANLDGNTITTHQEVLEAGRLIVPKLEALVRGVLHRL
jgi:purine-nucleoside phosphorylase